MSDSNSDQEKYSIHEILDRLKQRSPEQAGAQLVTRADGTHILKVRRRKRRTEQPRDRLKAHNQRIQLLQIGGLIVFVVLALLVAGGLILYANSSAYREKLVGKIERISGSKVKLQKFRMNPATASASALEMQWPESHLLRRLEVTGLTAKIAPMNFLGHVFHGEELVASKAKLFLSGQSIVSRNIDGGSQHPDESIKFNRYYIPSVDIFFSEQPGKDRMLEQSEISCFQGASKSDGEIRLNQGMLKMKGWPELALDRSYIRVRDGEMDVQTMRLHSPGNRADSNNVRGYIDFSGKIRFADPGEVHTLNAQLEDFQFACLLGRDLGRFFRGNVTNLEKEDSLNRIEFRTDTGDAVLNLHLTQAVGSRIQMVQCKFLVQLAMVLDDPWYEMPVFDHDIQLRLKRSGEKVEVETFQFKQRGKMVITGSLSTHGDEGGIHGNMRVGIPNSSIQAADNRRLEALFSPESNGYRWLNVELKGTSAMPLDDFKERYQAVDLTTDQRNESPKAAEQPESENIDTFDDLIKGE
ncbi:MAG: hypothetical protein RL346_345 [Verrucomicrobiota bacterium]|jgi:hypothetical protein